MNTIRLANYSDRHFRGWVRCGTDFDLPGDHGEGWVAGHHYGEDLCALDVWADLAPFQVKEIPVETTGERDYSVENAVVLLERFGLPRLNGILMGFVSVERDGAGHAVHLRCRFGRMFCADLRVLCHTGQAWAHGVLTVTCSNPAVPDLTEQCPPLSLTISNGVVVPEAGALSMRDAGTFATGQARCWPVTLLSNGGAAAMAGCIIAVNACNEPSPFGVPHLPANFDRLGWARDRITDALRAAHQWAPTVHDVGPLPRSGSTGAQSDMVFVGGECVGVAGLGSEIVRHRVALTQSRRPCHHLEVDGGLLRLDQHPDLRLWDGAVHWHSGVSPDRLGKVGTLTEEMANGYWGPDVEHLTIGNLCTVARLTACPTVQWMLEAQANVYLLQWTTEPGLATSQPYASRAVGWEALAAVQLSRTLRSDVFAGQAEARWRDRWLRIIRPAYIGLNVVDIRTDDPRLGSGPWVIAWQQSVAAYGLDVAGKHFGVLGARSIALRLARWVLDNAWRQDGARWVSAPVLPLSTTDETPDFAMARRHVHEDAGIPLPETDAVPAFDESFNRFGMPLAVAVVLRHDPNDARARAILAQLLADGGGSWIAPEIVHL